MEKFRVKSSAILSIGYDEHQRILTVEFKNEKEYSYLNVGLETFKDFVGSDSIGKFYNQWIKPNFEEVQS